MSTELLDVDLETTINEISSAYLNAPHEPDNPAWGPFIAELEKQYREMRDEGIIIAFSEIPRPVDEFTFPHKYRQIFRESRLEIPRINLPITDHPMSQFSPFHVGGYVVPLQYFDVLKAVHTYYGHFLGYYGYSFEGRVGAYKKHLERFIASGAYTAIPALFSETIGAWCASHTQAGVQQTPKKARVIRATF